MLKINKKVEYALMALKFMAYEKTQGQVTSAREICDRLGTPFDTTSKVMQCMNNFQILKSVKGTKGGYTLACELGSITYMQLERMIEKKDSENVCGQGAHICELYENCNIVSSIEGLNASLNTYLERLTLKQLFEIEQNALAQTSCANNLQNSDLQQQHSCENSQEKFRV